MLPCDDCPTLPVTNNLWIYLAARCTRNQHTTLLPGGHTVRQDTLCPDIPGRRSWYAFQNRIDDDGTTGFVTYQLVKVCITGKTNYRSR